MVTRFFVVGEAFLLYRLQSRPVAAMEADAAVPGAGKIRSVIRGLGRPGGRDAGKGSGQSSGLVFLCVRRYTIAERLTIKSQV